MNTKLVVLFVVAAATTVSAKTVRVSSFGYDAADSTAFIKAAVESDADEVVFDQAAGPWFATALKFSNLANKTIRFEKGVELRAKPGEFRDPKSGNCLMTFGNCENITLSGYGATFRMDRAAYDKPPYVHSEHRHCLNLRGVRNFRVEGLTFTESGGDGIFIGGSWTNNTFRNAENVFLKDVVCDRNYRQGLSIIAVSNFVAESCVFSNTRGTPPESGVDIEPNQAHEAVSGIVFRNCRFENNAGRGLEFYIGNLNSKTPPVTALLERCLMRGNINGFEYQQSRKRYADLPRGGEVVLRDCRIEESRSSGILLIDKTAESAKLVFENVALSNCCTTSSDAPDIAAYTRLVDTPPPDGLSFKRVTIARERDRPWITPGRIDFTTTGAHAVSGDVTLVTCGKRETVRFDGAWCARFAPQPKDGPTRPRVAGKLGRVETVDPAPGEMMPLSGAILAGTHRAVFMVDRIREVKFRVKHVKLHAKRPVTLTRMLVTTYVGSKCGYLKMPETADEVELVFTPKRTGLHAINIDAGRQGLAFLAATVPIAVEIADRPVSFGLSQTGTVGFFARTPFSLFAAANSYTKAHVALSDPAGTVVWEENPLCDARRYQGAAAPGMWTLALKRPKGMSRTVEIDLTGVRPFLFLSAERYWISKED